MFDRVKCFAIIQLYDTIIGHVPMTTLHLRVICHFYVIAYMHAKFDYYRLFCTATLLLS